MYLDVPYGIHVFRRSWLCLFILYHLHIIFWKNGYIIPFWWGWAWKWRLMRYPDIFKNKCHVLLNLQLPWHWAPTSSAEARGRTNRFGDRSTLAVSPCTHSILWTNSQVKTLMYPARSRIAVVLLNLWGTARDRTIRIGTRSSSQLRRMAPTSSHDLVELVQISWNYLIEG